MPIFTRMFRNDFEQVLCLNNNASALRAFLVIHDTTLGPAFGGLRIWSYPNETGALEDAMRLARAMTYKCALAGIPGGGGKTVVLRDDRMDRPAALRFLGRVIENLGGRYYLGTDIGSTAEDMTHVATETSYVAHTELSDATARGVLVGIRACLARTRGTSSLEGIRVAVQGLGNVGGSLARRILQEGGHIVGCDIVPEIARGMARTDGVEVVEPDEIYDAPCDVFAPCALGRVIHPRTLPRLRCSIVAGAANNVLHSERLGERLRRRGIAYAPDFVVNSGALIQGAAKLLPQFARQGDPLQGIHETMTCLLDRSEREGVATNILANRMAEEKLRNRKTANDLYWPESSASQPG